METCEESGAAQASELVTDSVPNRSENESEQQEVKQEQGGNVSTAGTTLHALRR